MAFATDLFAVGPSYVPAEAVYLNRIINNWDDIIDTAREEINFLKKQKLDPNLRLSLYTIHQDIILGAKVANFQTVRFPIVENDLGRNLLLLCSTGAMIHHLVRSSLAYNYRHNFKGNMDDFKSTVEREDYEFLLNVIEQMKKAYASSDVHGVQKITLDGECFYNLHPSIPTALKVFKSFMPETGDWFHPRLLDTLRAMAETLEPKKPSATIFHFPWGKLRPAANP